MQEGSLATWVQVISAAAILIGLGLVVFELKQNRELANAQLYGDRLSDWMFIQGVTLSEEFASVRAKACFEPEKLTTSEYLEMYEFHSLLFASIDQSLEMEQITGFEGSSSWQDGATRSMQIILSTAAGRADWELTKNMARREIREFGERLIATNQIYNCSEHLGSYIQRAKDLAGEI